MLINELTGEFIRNNSFEIGYLDQNIIAPNWDQVLKHFADWLTGLKV